MAHLLHTEFAQSFETQEKLEETRLRAAISAEPLAFDTWLELIKQTEKYSEVQKSRAIYTEFLLEFPQYYPVWRKLAETYALPDKQHLVATTYERALTFLPVSVDIWLHYCI